MYPLDLFILIDARGILSEFLLSRGKFGLDAIQRHQLGLRLFCRSQYWHTLVRFKIICLSGIVGLNKFKRPIPTKLLVFLAQKVLDTIVMD